MGIAKLDSGCLYVSMEMTEAELMGRLYCKETGISIETMFLGQLTDQEEQALIRVENSIGSVPFSIHYESPSKMTLEALDKLIRKTEKRMDLKIVIIDYVNLFALPPKQLRTIEIEDIVQQLKQYARTFNICILLLAQLSRKYPAKGPAQPDTRPEISSIKDSSGIENNADHVWILHRRQRPKRPHQKQEDVHQPNETCELLLLKNRRGKCGEIELQFHTEKYCFSDL